nr:amine oxidase [flavin-containing] A [Onthophagus taurus]
MCTTKYDFDYDVIIIGGGIAGLSAALNIIERDQMLSVLILEATDSIGGRAKPIPIECKSNVSTFDSGGHFVSRRQTHLMNLLKRLDMEVVDYNFYGDSLTEIDTDRVLKSQRSFLMVGSDNEKDELVCFYKKLGDLCKNVSMENPMGSVESERLDSISMEEFILNELDSEVTRQHFRNIVRTTCGSEPVDVTPLFYLAYCNSAEGVLGAHLRVVNGGRQSYVNGGIHYLIEKMVEIIGENRIIINNPVLEITRSDQEVIICAIKKTLRCRCCIISVPPSKLLEIKFKPPLNPGKLKVLREMQGKTWIRFIATYKEPFWEKKELNGDVFINTKRAVKIVLNVSVPNCHVLTGLVDVQQFQEDFSNHDLEVLQQLSEYFGEEALDPLDYIERSWPESSQESAMCCNPSKLGIMKDFHEIRRPIGRLFFAGSETATYWYGHISGAIQTGLRAAMEVLFEIRPQVLCYEDIAELIPRRKMVSYYKEAMEMKVPAKIINFGWLERTATGIIGTTGAKCISTACNHFFVCDPNDTKVRSNSNKH